MTCIVSGSSFAWAQVVGGKLVWNHVIQTESHTEGNVAVHSRQAPYRQWICALIKLDGTGVVHRLALAQNSPKKERAPSPLFSLPGFVPSSAICSMATLVEPQNPRLMEMIR